MGRINYHDPAAIPRVKYNTVYYSMSDCVASRFGEAVCSLRLRAPKMRLKKPFFPFLRAELDLAFGVVIDMNVVGLSGDVVSAGSIASISAPAPVPVISICNSE